jgi:hypothetical protein
MLVLSNDPTSQDLLKQGFQKKKNIYVQQRDHTQFLAPVALEEVKLLLLNKGSGLIEDIKTEQL